MISPSPVSSSCGASGRGSRRSLPRTSSPNQRRCGRDQHNDSSSNHNIGNNTNDNGNTKNKNKNNTNNNDNDDPWTYHGEQLKHLDFPLGGIGTGNILLQGDGCLRGWDVQNQFHSTAHRPLHNLPPLGSTSTSTSTSATTQTRTNCWAISAAYDDDEDDVDVDVHVDTCEVNSLPRPSVLLRSANHYGIREFELELDEREPTPSSPASTEQSYSPPPPIPPDVPSLTVRGRYPIALVSYETRPSFPLSNITLEAMTPLVPTDSRKSGFPMAVFSIAFENPHPTKRVSVDVMQSTLNFIGWDGGKAGDEDEVEDEVEVETGNEITSTAASGGLPSCLWGGNINEPFVYNTPAPPPPPPPHTATEGLVKRNDTIGTNSSSGSQRYSCQGLFLHTSNDLTEDLTRKGSIALSAICPLQSQYQSQSFERDSAPTPLVPTVGLIKGVTSEEDLFRRFAARDFEDPEDGVATPGSPPGTTYAGAVIQSVTIPPLSKASVTFCLSWHFPYRSCQTNQVRATLPKDFFGNLYAGWFPDARDVATAFCDSFVAIPKAKRAKSKAQSKHKNLLEVTRLFVESLYGSTIPWEVLESAAGRLAICRSPTMFLTEAGIVLGDGGNGCGPLNATDVYGYTTLLERIFPEMARDMATSVFVRNFDLSRGGCLASFGEGGFAIDGALACVIKVYLVVLQSDPGSEFLRTVWPNVKRQMEAVLTKNVDANDKDGVIRGPQQTTYGGGPMNGANTFLGSYLLTALRATEAMATRMGDVNFAKKCSKQAVVSLTGYEHLCWREDLGYYVADVDERNCQNSYGTGCFLDQLASTGLSRACGFGCVFDPQREARARRSISRNNVVTNPPFRDEDSLLRRGDSGLRVCTYPSGRAKIGDGMPSSNKVSSGLSYGLVAGLIGDGNWEDASKVCSQVRERQSGRRKSPWNEPESGGLYSARSMAGWNLFDQACGFSYDSNKASIGFGPTINADDFSCFCTFHEGFGEFKQHISSGNGDGDGDGNVNGNGIIGFSNGTISFQVLYGSTELQTIHLNTTAHIVVATLDGHALEASIAVDGVVGFGTKIVIGEDSTLKLTLSGPCRATKHPTPVVIRINEKAYSSPLSSKRVVGEGLRRRRARCLGVLFVAISILYVWISAASSNINR